MAASLIGGSDGRGDGRRAGSAGGAAALIETTQERWAEAKMHRPRGTLLLSMHGQAAAQKLPPSTYCCAASKQQILGVACRFSALSAEAVVAPAGLRLPVGCAVARRQDHRAGPGLRASAKYIPKSSCRFRWSATPSGSRPLRQDRPALPDCLPASAKCTLSAEAPHHGPYRGGE